MFRSRQHLAILRTNHELSSSSVRSTEAQLSDAGRINLAGLWMVETHLKPFGLSFSRLFSCFPIQDKDKYCSPSPRTDSFASNTGACLQNTVCVGWLRTRKFSRNWNVWEQAQCLQIPLIFVPDCQLWLVQFWQEWQTFLSFDHWAFVVSWAFVGCSTIKPILGLKHILERL